MIQETLSVLYAGLVLIVFLTTLWVCWRAIQQHTAETAESPIEQSRIFAPAAFVPTPLEQEVLEEWKAAGLDPTPIRAHH